MVCVEQPGGHQQGAVVVEEARRTMVDLFPGELFDDDLPAGGEQFDGVLEDAVQVLCVVQGSGEQYDVVFAGDVVDVAMDGRYPAFGGGRHCCGVAINACHLIAQICQGSGQSASAAADFEDSGRRRGKKRLQMGEGRGHGNGCQVHPMSRPEPSSVEGVPAIRAGPAARPGGEIRRMGLLAPHPSGDTVRATLGG